MVAGGYNSQWLTPEMLTFFPVHAMRALNHREELDLIEALVGLNVSMIRDWMRLNMR